MKKIAALMLALTMLISIVACGGNTETTTEAKTTESTQGEYEIYVIKSGDNYYSVLRACGIADTPANVQKLCDYNGIAVGSGLSVGQQIKVPADF